MEHGEGPAFLSPRRALDQLWMSTPFFHPRFGLPHPKKHGRRKRGKGNEGDSPGSISLPLACSRSSAGELSLRSMKTLSELIALLMGEPHFSIDLGFDSPGRMASDCSNGGGGGTGFQSWPCL